ncbi:hypothetical protein BD289DRAFT_430456 [Coniella lustricola]|uniref:DNA/RNA-binding domain-containing protein n=1 Tax=Coniella lustricola TaxID=2025994 RepID=A0A2T3AC35_9PEZI|nr:hypothetical protein BD289DRAFT_430456 [Coniella lustricola]
MSHIIAGFNKALRRKAQEEDQAKARGEPSAQPAGQSETNADDGHSNIATQEHPLSTRRSAERIDDGSEPEPKRLKSPSTSIKAADEAALPIQSRAGDNTSDFSRPATTSKGKLWHDGDPGLPRSAAGRHAAQPRASRPPGRRPKATPVPPAADESDDLVVSSMLPQPETRSITQEQLVAEVKGIYAGLVMVESKCIEVDSAQSVQSDSASRLNNEQWQALIALHRTLLHEHHDFFLASQHPSASQALKKLAQKYAMPARMWRHAIHSFLELLRHRLPASLEHMLTFIYLAYSMMALLYETVPAFEDTWVECLGDLGRYRMAIEDEDIRDREIWTGVSRYWYTKASDKAPTTGRLYHHLAILARPNALQQLFYYTKSLCVAIPFKSARDSILTLFEPVLNGTQSRQMLVIDFHFLKTHANLFNLSNANIKEKPLAKPLSEIRVDLDNAASFFITNISSHIARSARGWMESGSFIAIANSNALLEYGKVEANVQGDQNVIMALISPKAGGDVQMGNTGGEMVKPTPSKVFKLALKFVMDCDNAILLRQGDNNILPYLHVRLAFLLFMADKPAMEFLENNFHWARLCDLLNSLTGIESFDRVEAEAFPQPTNRPLPEDWYLWGLLWTEGLFPVHWHSVDAVDEDEKTFELPSMTAYRRERVLWLGNRLASFKKWMVYDKHQKRFAPNAEFADDPADLREEVELTEADFSLPIITTSETAANSKDSGSDSNPAEIDSMAVETDRV